MNRIIILVPHVDDGEFGCGGTIAKLTNTNKHVYYIAFSHPFGFQRKIILEELSNSADVLFIPHENIRVYDFPVREFGSHRQEILDQMVSLDKDINPDTIFMPSLNDTHQDHKTIAEEGMRAFKRKNILHYELPWNNLSFKTACFIPLHKMYVRAKIKALECYKSQSKRAYIDKDFICGLAKTRGVQIEAPYAEAFEVGRWII